MADYSLKDYLRAKMEEKTPVSDTTLQYICKNFVLACAVLHAKGLVHLDIKPENIMRCGPTWKLIDVDGCTSLNTKISINDSSISFSPCYCAPEWANFLIEDSDFLTVGDQLDVWSVGISLCELVMLDAVLKPKYSSIYKHAGSHRKAGFLFLEWLSKKDESLALDEKILNYRPDFVDLVVSHMLVKDEERRWSLAECLAHPFLANCTVPGLDGGDLRSSLGGNQSSAQQAEMQFAEKLKEKKRKERLEETVSDKPPLLVGVLFKLNSDGEAKDPNHWLKRDMWLSHDGNLCYFSQKKGRRLVLLDAATLARGRVEKMSSEVADSAQKFAFTWEVQKSTAAAEDVEALVDHEGEIQRDSNGQTQNSSIKDSISEQTPTTENNENLKRSETQNQLPEDQHYAAESAEQRDQWIAMLRKVIQAHDAALENKNVLQISKTLVKDFRNFKIQIRNRREKIDPNKIEFQVVFKRELWKLNQGGDKLNPEHWLKREMWLARNGAFCYFSKKENKELQYYKSEDIKSVICSDKFAYPEQTCRPNTFSLQLKSADGLEYEPGFFASEDEETKLTFLGCIAKFQSRVKAKQEAREAAKKG